MTFSRSTRTWKRSTFRPRYSRLQAGFSRRRGLGEIGITGTAAAIANAIFHVTGKRIRDLPVTPEKVYSKPPLPQPGGLSDLIQSRFMSIRLTAAVQCRIIPRD